MESKQTNDDPGFIEASIEEIVSRPSGKDNGCDEIIRRFLESGLTVAKLNVKDEIARAKRQYDYVINDGKHPVKTLSRHGELFLLALNLVEGMDLGNAIGLEVDPKYRFMTYQEFAEELSLLTLREAADICYDHQVSVSCGDLSNAIKAGELYGVRFKNRVFTTALAIRKLIEKYQHEQEYESDDEPEEDEGKRLFEVKLVVSHWARDGQPIEGDERFELEKGHFHPGTTFTALIMLDRGETIEMAEAIRQNAVVVFEPAHGGRIVWDE